MRTISLTQGWERLKCFVDLSRVEEAKVYELIEIRNGGMHRAVAAFDEGHLLSFLEVTDAVLEDLGESRTTYWGERLNKIQSRLGESRTELANAARARMHEARAHLDTMPLHQRQALADFARSPDWNQREAPYACPVCQGPCIALGSYGSGGEWRDDGGDETFSVESIGCQVCGVKLNAKEMLELKLPTELQVDWFVDWDVLDPEPDWADVYAQQEIDRIRGK